MSASLEQEFLNFIDKKSSRNLMADMQRGSGGGDEQSTQSKETATTTSSAASQQQQHKQNRQQRMSRRNRSSSSHGSGTGGLSQSMHQGGGRSSSMRRLSSGGGGLSQSLHHNAPSPALSRGSGSRRALLSKSLSKEDLQVEKVSGDDFAFGDNDFDVDWDEAGKQPERKSLARSRRLGPGDRRKELMRRGSSRRLLGGGLGDSQHGGGGNSSLDGNSAGEPTAANGGLDRSSSHTTSRRTLITHSRRGSARGMASEEIEGSSAADAGNKMTTKGLREDMELSFSDLPKEWQTTPSSNQLGASFLPRRGPAAAPGNPRVNRRASLSGPTPALQRRLSQRGLMVPPADEAEEELAGAPQSAPVLPTRHVPRRHSLMGSLHEEGSMRATGPGKTATAGRPTRTPRQRSRRLVRSNSTEENDKPTEGRQRTTMVPRRLSSSGGAPGYRDVGSSTRRSLVNKTATSNTFVTGEALAGANIRW